MKGLFVRLWLIINIVLAVLLLLAYLSVLINPGKIWVFAFIGMAYPFLIGANVLFILFWMIFRRWFFIISLICVIAGWNSIRKHVQVRFKKQSVENTAESFKLLTYNVRLFNYYEWNADAEAQSKIMTYIQEENPDIVCFQEFITIPGTDADLHNLKKQLAYLPYEHISYTNIVPGKINFGMATFSRYPIVHRGEIDFKESLNGSIYSDVVYAGDTFRIYNCHLQSIRLNRNYNNLVDSLIFNYSERQLAEIKNISLRMREAFVQRAEQVNVLSVNAASSTYPLIICGDFNDTPVSFAYKKLAKGMKDAFVESGSGFGTTYRGLFPYMRIDYILCSNTFKVHNFRIEKMDWSDHYPVVSEFTFLQRED